MVVAAAHPADPESEMRSYLQRIATGPELSKDLSRDETCSAMRLILDGQVDPVQAGVFLIALRMKRETDDENRGVLRALIDAAEIATAPVDDVVDIADPYDGHARGLPASPFLPAVLAACGVPAVTHGLESVAPKFGVTQRMVLRAAGAAVDLTPRAAAARLAEPDIAWAYVDQKDFCPKLHGLVPLRRLIVKRPCLSTIEVLVGPVRGCRRTHLMTGYVHKAYPRVYALLAREAGFDSALIVRGVEGGVIPSLQQPAKLFYYHNKSAEQSRALDPAIFGISQPTRAVPLPGAGSTRPAAAEKEPPAIDAVALAKYAAEAGLAALAGAPGPMRDSLVYGAAICLMHLERHDSAAAAAEQVRQMLDAGVALARFRNGAR